MSKFRDDCGFPCEYTPTIQDGPVFRWGDNGFEVSASRNGVMISGHSKSMTDLCLVRFRALMCVVESVHFQLKTDDEREDMWFGCDRVQRAAWEGGAQ